jgi:hypothetical protein
MNRERLKTIFSFGVLPLLILWPLHLVGASFFQLIFFVTAFYWNLALASGIEQSKADTHRYRFSFLKLSYRLHRSIEAILPKLPNYLVRTLSPFLFSVITVFFAPDWHPFFALGGSALFEGLRLVLQRSVKLEQ